MTRLFFIFAAPLLLLADIAGAAEGYAVFKSKDRGMSWVRSDNGLPAGSRINAFAAAFDELVFAGTDSGIFVSGDEARSWQLAMGGSGRVISLATLQQRVFAGTESGGLWVSDKGQTWVANAAFPSKKVRCLLAHQGKLYAGTDNKGVFASSNDGQDWVPLQQGLPVQAQVFALSAIEGKLFAGLYSKGLYAWNEPEQRWSKVGPVKPLVLAAVHGTLVVGHNPGGLYWSDDLGATWSKGEANAVSPFTAVFSDNSVELPSEAPVWELVSNDELVFAGASKGIYFSEDRGRTWSRTRKGLPEAGPGISFLVSSNFVLAGIQINGGGF